MPMQTVPKTWGRRQKDVSKNQEESVGEKLEGVVYVQAYLEHRQWMDLRRLEKPVLSLFPEATTGLDWFIATKGEGNPC